MFDSLLSEINGTERLSHENYFHDDFGIKLGNSKIARYPKEVLEITDVKKTPTTTIRNSLGYRCDEITPQSNKLHVLFSGCSTTYGSGLPYNDTWAKQVYDKLSERYDVGPYVNIARPAASAFSIISEVFKYINEFGKPDIIALSFPSIFRGYKTSEDGILYNSHWPDWFMKSAKELEQVSKSLLPYVNDYLMMIDAFCRESGIKLYMFTWESGPEPMGVKSYSGLEVANNIFIDFSDMVSSLYGNKKYSNKELLANDEAHLGKPFHDEFASKILDRISQDMAR